MAVQFLSSYFTSGKWPFANTIILDKAQLTSLS